MEVNRKSVSRGKAGYKAGHNTKACISFGFFFLGLVPLLLPEYWRSAMYILATA